MKSKGEALYEESEDTGGHVWTLDNDIANPVEAFWGHGARLCLRQENAGMVDLIELDLRQAYALMAVCARALDVGPYER